MAFLEQRLDSKIEHGAKGGPTNPGRVKAYTRSGKLSQGFYASMPIHRYDVSHGIRNKADFQRVLDLWYVVNFTPYEGFRFKDHRDYQGTRANTALTLVSGSTYQLQRAYTFGASTFLRNIYKPVEETVIVYDADGDVLDSTVDYTTGIATVTGTPDSWAGEFDVPVTFTDNEWASSLEVHTENLHLRIDPIKLEEIRL
jgi:uncharacterized protein (TIGR02217 family)